jgi:hypothetical protein
MMVVVVVPQLLEWCPETPLMPVPPILPHEMHLYV